jgi:hypothetical protein
VAETMQSSMPTTSLCSTAANCNPKLTMEPDIASRNFVVCVDGRWKSREAEKVKLCAPEPNTHPKVIELEIYPSNVEATLPQRIWSVK